MYNLPSIAKQKVEVEMIARKDAIRSLDQVKNALAFYFKSLFRSLAVVMLSVFASMANLLFMILTIKTEGEPSPLWQIILVVFIFSSPAFLVVGAKMLDTKILKGEIMERFVD